MTQKYTKGLWSEARIRDAALEMYEALKALTVLDLRPEAIGIELHLLVTKALAKAEGRE